MTHKRYIIPLWTNEYISFICRFNEACVYSNVYFTIAANAKTQHIGLKIHLFLASPDINLFLFYLTIQNNIIFYKISLSSLIINK